MPETFPNSRRDSWWRSWSSCSCWRRTFSRCGSPWSSSRPCRPCSRGVVVALWLTGTTLNIQSFMGAIMAIGVAVANAILLVTFAERRRRRGRSPHAAAIERRDARMRPILMTSAAMIAGMIPMALAIGEGAEATAPLGRAVIGGLAAATLATLVVLPSVYSLLQQSAHHHVAIAGSGRSGQRVPSTTGLTMTKRDPAHVHLGFAAASRRLRPAAVAEPPRTSRTAAAGGDRTRRDRRRAGRRAAARRPALVAGRTDGVSVGGDFRESHRIRENRRGRSRIAGPRRRCARDARRAGARRPATPRRSRNCRAPKRNSPRRVRRRMPTRAPSTARKPHPRRRASSPGTTSLIAEKTADASAEPGPRRGAERRSRASGGERHPRHGRLSAGHGTVRRRRHRAQRASWRARRAHEWCRRRRRCCDSSTTLDSASWCRSLRRTRQR